MGSAADGRDAPRAHRRWPGGRQREPVQPGADHRLAHRRRAQRRGVQRRAGDEDAEALRARARLGVQQLLPQPARVRRRGWRALHLGSRQARAAEPLPGAQGRRRRSARGRGGQLSGVEQEGAAHPRQLVPQRHHRGVGSEATAAGDLLHRPKQPATVLGDAVEPRGGDAAHRRVRRRQVPVASDLGSSQLHLPG